MTQLYAISFLAPIFSAWIASIMLDDEDLSRSKVLALITGLLGTIVIIRPGFTEVSPFLILGLLAPLLWGFTTVSTKRLSNEYSHLTLLFILALCTMSLSLPFALLSWTPLSPEFWTFALGIATVGLIVHISFIKAYKYAPLIDIVPMEFSMLIFASLYASIFFAEGFDAWVYLGASLIVASNLYIILRS